MRHNFRHSLDMSHKSGNILTCRQCGFTGTKRIIREVVGQVGVYNGACRSIWEGKQI